MSALPVDPVPAPVVEPPVAEPALEGPEPAAVEVLAGGPATSVQDVPGRVGYWHVGVPPNGPMDDLSHRLVNRVLGNRAGAAALELTGSGPTLRFDRPVVVALGGAGMPMAVDGRPVPAWTPVPVPTGAVVSVGAVEGAGLRATLGVRGGLDTPPYLGSRATFTLGRFGGHEGRNLVEGDRLPVGNDVERAAVGLAPGLAPVLRDRWELGVLVGPHAAPDFLTTAGLEALLGTTWEVHFNSARTGVRLVGPKPRWARADGGDAGLHPSNIHDTGYAIGAVDLTGDMPVVLGPDGPSLGGFVCPAVVVAAERWKLGQLRPGDLVRLVPRSATAVRAHDEQREWWLARATDRIEPVAHPWWNTRLSRRSRTDDQPGGPVLAAAPAEDGKPALTVRRAGDRFALVELGPMELDLELRLRIEVLGRWAHEHLGPGLVDATPGVRSLLVQVDGRRLSTAAVADAVLSVREEVEARAEEPVASRIVHLPLSWDDPAIRTAIDRYELGVHPGAPWWPSNIEFIRRINGLASVEDVHRTVFDASYLVLGLGDVYLGAPVATPLDPRHRLVTTKYNPARTWTAENSVGIGGAYLCIYGMEGPGGYQLVGRTVQVWNRERRGPLFSEPWLLRPFDQLRWFPVEADDLLERRAAQEAGQLDLQIEESTFDLAAHRALLAEHADGIAAFRATQRAAFAAERQAWAESGQLAAG